MNQKNNIVEIEGVKKFDLNDPNQAMDFLIYILNKESLYPRLTDSIIKQIFGFGLAKYIKDRNTYLDTMLDINEFFEIFISDLDFNNIFYKYFVENKEDSDLIKKQKADSLFIGLKKCIDYLWERGSISTIDMHVEEKLSELHNLIRSNDLYIYALPTYHIYKNFKKLYDILWNQYSTFIDTSKHKFSNFYSNSPITKAESSDKENIKIDITHNPYPDTFKLGDTYNCFLKYTQRHIVEPYADYSYLFQRLLHEKLIYKTTQKDFFSWLHNNKFITDKVYHYFFEKGHFRSLDKSSTIQRENNFNNIFNT